MKTNVKVTALALSGVFLVSGLVTQLHNPVAPVAPKTLKVSQPLELVEHYGLTVPNTPVGRELAEYLHVQCNTASAWYNPEPSHVCKVERLEALKEALDGSGR